MRKLITLLFFVCIAFSAKSQGEEQTIKLSLTELIDSLTLESWQVNYSSSSTNTSISISLNKEKKEWQDILTEFKYKGVGSLIENKNITFFPSKIEYISIQGFLKEVGNSENILFANIYSSDYKLQSSTNEFGYFQISAPKGNLNLHFSHVGYNHKLTNLHLTSDTLLQIRLAPKPVTLPSIEVKNETRGIINEANLISVNIQDIKNDPLFLGENQISGTLQTLPGVQMGAQGINTFYVRGGGSDENLILLDGMPLYNYTHLFGFISVFNVEAIQNINVHKGGFGPSHSGRLSSVLDIRLKEGNDEHLKGMFSFSPLSIGYGFDGPVGKKGNFLLTGRSSWWGAFANVFQIALDGYPQFKFNFMDVNAKYKHQINNNTTLQSSLIYINDNYGNDLRRGFNNDSLIGGQILYDTINYGINWTSLGAQIQINSILNTKSFISSSLRYSQFQNQSFQNLGAWAQQWVTPDSNFIGYNKSSTNYDFNTNLKDISVNTDYNLRLNNSEYLKTNFTINYYQMNSLFKNIDSLVIDSQSVSAFNQNDAFEINMGVQDNITISNTKISVGANIMTYFGKDFFYIFPQPRISIKHKLKSWTFNLSYDRMAQAVRKLNYTNFDSPLDPLILSGKLIDPKTSSQLYSGLSLTSKKLQIELGGFYKALQNDIWLQQGLSVNTIDEYEPKKIGLIYTQGFGTSKGIEFSIKRKGRFGYWLNHTYTQSSRQFGQTRVNDAQKFRFDFNRLNDLNIGLSFQINKKWSTSLKWTYKSGLPSLVNDQARDTTLWDEAGYYFTIIEQKELPAYHRLDVGFKCNKPKKWGRTVWQLSILNLYNQKNYIYDENVEFNNLSLPAYIPLLPSFSYSMYFE